MPLLETSKIRVWEWGLFKKKIAMEVLRLCIPYIKRYFQKQQWSAFLFIAEINQILLFSGMQFLERSKITVVKRHFFKKTCYGSFMYLPTLRQKVSSRAPVKRFSLYDSNYSDSLAFGNGRFAEIKNNSFRARSFQEENNCYGSFRYVSFLQIKVFSGAPVRCFSLYGWNNSDCF